VYLENKPKYFYTKKEIAGLSDYSQKCIELKLQNFAHTIIMEQNRLLYIPKQCRNGTVVKAFFKRRKNNENI
jgi:hypothetical protein